MGHRDFETTLIYAEYAPDQARERELVERGLPRGRRSVNWRDAEDELINAARRVGRFAEATERMAWRAPSYRDARPVFREQAEELRSLERRLVHAAVRLAEVRAGERSSIR
jgi:hypothetical protein